MQAQALGEDLSLPGIRALFPVRASSAVHAFLVSRTGSQRSFIGSSPPLTVAVVNQPTNYMYSRPNKKPAVG